MEFLNKVIHELAREKFNWGETVIVTPNKRAGLFLKQYILNHSGIEKPVWMPELCSIQEFVSQVSDLVLLDNLTLIFKLFPIYQTIFNNPRNFDDFYEWGNVVLSDFNEIDLYLTDRDALFKQLKDLSHIDMEFGAGGPIMADFVRFSASLQKLYDALIRQLIDEGQGYYGLALRHCVETFEVSRFEKWQHIVFAGFNALAKGEEILLQKLMDSGKTRCFWDMDSLLYNDIHQEAGYFLRQNSLIKDPHQAQWIDDELAARTGDIHIIGVAGRVAQAKVLGNMLEDAKPRDEDTAVVLGDESLLFPVLHAMPPSVNQINVTMGYPLNNTSFFHLIDALFELHLNRDVEDPNAVRFLQLKPILLHPYLLPLAETAIKELIRGAEKDNQVRIDLIQIEALNPRLKGLFEPMETASQFMKMMKELIRHIAECIKDNQQLSMEVEVLFQFYHRLQRLEDIIDEFSIALTLHTFRKLFGDIVSSASVPFLGEPLQGLQIMGLLETRTLDFKQVYLLSANEGILPAGQKQQTFIPFEVRQERGMQTHAHADAVFAYYFFRLLKAEQVTILYSTLTDAFGKGERSRFIDQLLHELKERLPNRKIYHKFMHTEAVYQNPDAIVIHKTPEILKKMMDEPFSPTRLQAFVDCPLKFYFRYVLELKENNEVVESADARIFGSIIHDVLEKLFEPRINQPLTPHQLEDLRKEAPHIIQSVYIEKMGAVDLNKGRNYVNRRIIEQLIDTYLTGEQLGKRVLSNEKQYSKTIDVEGVSITLQGQVDRIEEYENIVNIIDFKTGMVKSLTFDLYADWDTETLFDALHRQKQVLQLLFYGLIASEMASAHGKAFRMGVYSFKAQKEMGNTKFLIPGVKKEAYVLKQEDAHRLILPLLKEILKPLLNSEISFEQTSDRETCALCAYRDVCGK